MTNQQKHFFTCVIILLVFLVTTGSANAAENHGIQKPKYGHCVDVGFGGCETERFSKTGKGYAVCESYLKHINLPRETPKCEAPVPPGFKRPVWQDLDISAHLQMAYQAEAIKFNGRGGGYTQPDFETWRQQFLSEIQTGKIAPQLRKTTVHPFGTRSIALLAYTRDQAGCKVVAMGKDSWWGGTGYLHFLLANDPEKPLREILHRVSKTQSELLLYSGTPYFVMIDSFDPSYEIIAFDLEMTDTSAQVASMNAYDASVKPGERVDFTRRNLVPDPNVYWAGQLCHFKPKKPSKR